MKLALLLIFLLATPALAQQYEFRGDFVETYLAEDGFLDKIPRGTRLNCDDGICSKAKSVRIYVFKNRETTKKFWSTDLCDVMFDGPEQINACGGAGHVAFYDETGQLWYRDPQCH